MNAADQNRRRSCERAIRGIALVGMAFTLASSSACTRNGAGGDGEAVEAVTTSTVVAQERRVTSVLVLDAVVVVNPLIRVAAPQDGVLVALPKGRVGLVSAPGSAPTPIDLPESCAIVSLLVEPGTRVEQGLPIINARYTGFAMQATVPAEQVYRLYEGVKSVRAQVQVGPGPFDTTLLGVPYPPGAITLSSDDEASASVLEAGEQRQPRLVLCDVPTGDLPASAQSSKETSSFPVITAPLGDPKGGVVVIVRVPSGLELIEGMPGRVALTTADVTGVALPIEAVAGIAERGQVYVVKDGRVELRDVTLGVTDGSYVQITAGLSAGDVVQIPSPTLVDVD
ncbi:MAG: hypothetical protein ABFC80_02690 [Coriobacteriales bacterium]|nr:hypothetical protein [Actinomycetes bacterium]